MTAVRIYTSSGWQEIMYRGADGAQGPSSSARPPFVATLPGSPVHGQEIWLQHAYTNDYTRFDYPAGMWHLRYNANNPTVSKWEFIEGTPLLRANLNSHAQGSFPSATWTQLGNINDQCPVALRGIYDVEHGGSFMMPNACTIAISIGDTPNLITPAPTLGTDSSEENAAAGQYVNITNRKRVTQGYDGANPIRFAAYQTGPVGTMTVRGLFFHVTPVSIG